LKGAHDEPGKASTAILCAVIEGTVFEAKKEIPVSNRAGRYAEGSGKNLSDF
jgi:hypothetical protein